MHVLIVDDHPVFRDGLFALLKTHLQATYVHQAEGHDDAMRAMRAHRFDLVTIDIGLKQGSGLSLLSTIQAEWPRVPLVVVSMYDELTHAERAFEAGAHGYVMKTQPWEDLVKTLRAGASGQYAFSPAITRSLLKGRHAADEAGMRLLSNREVEVFALIGKGIRVREVAIELHISPKTVESHIANIKRKLGIEHSNELVYRATLWRHLR